MHVRGDHGWDLLSPPEAREHRAMLGEMCEAISELAARAAMAPVFGQDGDLLLLAADGTVHTCSHDGWRHDRRPYESFDELLRILIHGVRDARVAERAND